MSLTALTLAHVPFFFSFFWERGARRDVEGEEKSCRPHLSISHVPVLTELNDFSFFHCVQKNEVDETDVGDSRWGPFVDEDWHAICQAIF